MDSQFKRTLIERFVDWWRETEEKVIWLIICKSENFSNWICKSRDRFFWFLIFSLNLSLEIALVLGKVFGENITSSWVFLFSPTYFVLFMYTIYKVDEVTKKRKIVKKLKN